MSPDQIKREFSNLSLSRKAQIAGIICFNIRKVKILSWIQQFQKPFFLFLQLQIADKILTFAKWALDLRDMQNFLIILLQLSISNKKYKRVNYPDMLKPIRLTALNLKQLWLNNVALLIADIFRCLCMDVFS